MPLDANEEQLISIMKKSSDNKLNTEGPFYLFMTDLVCQLPFDVSTVIHDAIKRDMLPSSTQEYKPELNENNIKAIEFRDVIYPELQKNKEKLLNYLMIQLALSNFRVLPDRFDDKDQFYEAIKNAKVN